MSRDAAALVPGLALLFTLAGCDQDPAAGSSLVGPETATPAAPLERSYEQRVGTAFTADFPRSLETVVVEELGIPSIPGADAIWGALGRDDRGHIWIGLSTGWQHNARLYEFVPDTGEFLDHGDAVAALKRAGIHREGEMQAKIHSHIQQADDGFIYFTSMDETGESWRERRVPKWGSHLWRIKPETGVWEHILSVREGLIALNAVGRYVYALGYWDHVVYQYDTRTGTTRKATVGSACGHVSRNFLADLRGHLYVPRLISIGSGADACKLAQVRAALVELNADLEIVAEHDFEGYLGRRKPAANHGITGYTFRADESLLFITHTGEIHHVIVTGRQPALVMRLGRIHPGKIARLSSLFSVDGKNLLATVGRLDKQAHWVRHDLETMQVDSVPLDLPPHRGLLLYGSMTRDNGGDFYLGGRLQAPDGPMRPVLFRMREMER